MDGPTRANPDFGTILVSVTTYYCNLYAAATEYKPQDPHRTTNRRRIANRATRGRAELPPVGSHNRARPTLDTNQHRRKKQAHLDTAGPTSLRQRQQFELIVVDQIVSRIIGTKTQHNLCRFFTFLQFVTAGLIDLERYSFSSFDSDRIRQIHSIASHKASILFHLLNNKEGTQNYQPLEAVR